MPSYAALAREIVMNCSFVVIGGCGAIMLRLLGYSIVSHTNILEVATTWMSELPFRFSGDLIDYLAPARIGDRRLCDGP
jgi:hypothetical protein